MSNRKSVTMSDVAHRLHISTVSVSKALQNKEGIGDELRQTIIKTATEMGYRYNYAAKSMRSGSTSNIGIIISEQFVGQKDAFYWKISNLISKELAACNYLATVETVLQQDEQQLCLPAILQSKRVDGLIVLGQMHSDYLDMLSAEGLPMVLTDFYNDSVGRDTVTTDNFYSAYLLTNHLLQCGHRQIGFVGSIHATSSILDRYLGYCKSLLEHGLELVPQWLVEDRDSSGKMFIPRMPDISPTAFVCNCDQTAYFVCQSLVAAGLSVPDDVSLVGFDDDVYATVSSPQLTTVEVDAAGLAACSVDCLMNRLSGDESLEIRRVISGKLVLRNSVKIIS